jgi:hypothetical protein
MKIKFLRSILLIIAFVLGTVRCFSQSFVNLDFEDAQITPLADSPFFPFGITTTNALPGWAVFIGNSEQSQITYNDPALGSTSVSLWVTNSHVISGNFSVFLQGGLSASAATISQTGLVPISTLSLLFDAQPGIGTLQVSLAGQNIPFFALSTGTNYTLYGGNIPSGIAGESEQLMFSALPAGGGSGWTIDDIQFSSSAVPEPNQLALSALGALLLGFRRWQKIS